MWRKELDSVDRYLLGCEREIQTGYFARFLQKYNETEYQQSIRCQNCNTNCRELLSICREDERKYFGTQHFTCYDCLSHYCYNCSDEDAQFYLNFCDLCDKFRCKYCMTMKPCQSCLDDAFNRGLQLHPNYSVRNNISFMCNDCEEDRKCEECGHVFCENCQEFMQTCDSCDRSGCETCMITLRCEREGCKAQTCGSCRDNNIDGYKGVVETCRGCRINLCFTHRLDTCKQNWDQSCHDCLVMIAPRLASRYEQTC